MKNLFLFILTLTTAIAADSDRITLVQNRFYGASIKSLADAGIAFPSEVFSGLLNPALTFSHHQTIPQSHGTMAVGYGRDSIFSRHMLPVGFSYSNDEGSLGLFYRFMKGKNEILQQEMTLNIASQVFAKSDDQGAVDFGVNLRFEKMVWENLPSRVEYFQADDSGSFTNVFSSDTHQLLNDYSIRDKRALLDIGFYQPHILENIDFGFVIRNLVGYVWTYGNPDTVFYDTLTDSHGTDSVLIKTYSYTDKKRAYRGWTKGIDRSLTIGLVYHAAMSDNRIQLNFPVDLEIRGLFNRHIKNRYTFRGGVEADIARHVMLRFGYARAPGRLRSSWEEIRNINVFTGGAGLKFSSLSFDFYVSEHTFGISGSFNY